MAILKIARMGHPVLRRPAAPVGDPAATVIRRLVSDMIETMREAGGVGLAAPQVHESRRIVVFEVPADRAAREGAEAVALTVLINPEIEPADDAVAEGWEACLSLPDLAGRVPRHLRIRYRGRGLDGEPIERLAEGYHARVVQHECDHLDGVLYVDRMRDLTSLSYIDELGRTRPEGL